MLEVLVIGAGPAGATAAIALARHGVATLLVERRTAPSLLPRATGVSTRSMELLRAWGLADAVREGAPEVIGARIPHVWLDGGASTLDLLGDGLTLLTGPWQAAAPLRRGGPPVAVRRLDAIAARAVGVPHGGTLLVRPDGAPVAATSRASVMPMAA